MVFSWIWFWWVLMLVFLIPSVGYGWGYRNWGPPYPSYLQRRRHARAGSIELPPDAGEQRAFNHLSWGWGGDFVWAVMIIGALWFVALVWWPR
jgi:hypothetical protein